MKATKCPYCGEELIEKADVCPKCGKTLAADTPLAVDNNSDNNKVEPQQSPKPKHSPTKRRVVRLLSTLFALALIAGGALIILFGSSSDAEDDGNGYAPWVDLGMYYDLTKINEGEDFAHFNSYELSSDRVAMTREHVADEEYQAVVLGTGVWVRSYPQLKNRTKRCQVQMGDQLMVTRSAGYSSGSYWSYVSVLSGRRAGKEGYISNDYIIKQEKYDVLQKYIFAGNSNMNTKTQSKYLNAIATVLLNLEVHKRYPNLEVTMLDTTVFGYNAIVTYRIHDMNMAKNSSLLAFVLFFNNNNDYVVLGVVPGSEVNQIDPNPNGSYDIYFVR